MKKIEKNQKIKIGVGGFTVSTQAKKAVLDALNHNRLSYGSYVKKFETGFAKLHQVNFAIFCNSGTSALQVALHALKIYYHWQDDDEVIMPAINFVSDPNIVYFNRLKAIFAEVDPITYNLDPNKLEEKITKKTKAIIVVHLCGLPANMEEVIKIAKKHKLKIIEDACETMAVKYKGKPVGSMSDISCFSTYAAHILITGVGGFACTNKKQLAILIKSLYNHGRDGIYMSIDDDDQAKGKKLFDIVDRRFKFIYPGYSYRATELEAAIGFTQLNSIKKDIQIRQKNAKYLTNNLNHLKDFIQLPFVPNDRQHAFMMYPILVKSKKISRDKLIHYLESQGIETRLLLPLLNQPVIKSMWGDQQKNYPVADNLNKKAFYIGCHPELTKNNLDYIVNQIEHFVLKSVK